RTLADSVTETLREAILTGQLEPGQKLAEESVTRQLGVSNGPLREALARLGRERLIRRQAKNCPVVADLSARDLSEIYSLRAMLEVLAQLLVVRNPSSDLLARLEENLRVLEHATTAEERARLDLHFHELFVRACGHERLVDLWETLRSQ